MNHLQGARPVGPSIAFPRALPHPRSSSRRGVPGSVPAVLLGVASILAAQTGIRAQSSPAAQVREAQPPPIFRSGVTVVPVDVRVLDRNGKPVADLRQDEFIVSEDDARQVISYFQPHSFQPLEVPRDAKPAFRTSAPSEPATQTGRVFLIVFGRGRLQAAAKGYDGAIHLVRNRLLPQDQVAVMAWNRATDFTNDHEQIAAVLEQVKRGSASIEQQVNFVQSGLAGLFGTSDYPEHVQRGIEEIFRAPGAATSRRVGPAVPSKAPPGAGMELELQASRRLAAAGAEREGSDPVSPAPENPAADAGLAATTGGSPAVRQDIELLLTGIDYMRRLEGEKHLVFVTSRGLVPGQADVLASRANHARVVIDTIFTGGVRTAPIPDNVRAAATASMMSPGPIVTPTFAFQDRIDTLRDMATETGGQASSTEYASTAVDLVDQATRFSYLLGYRPTNQVIDARFRRIAVRVTRPGLTVLFRHGYFANEGPPPFNPAEFEVERRISVAGLYDKDITDIPIKLKAWTLTRTGSGGSLDLDLIVDPARMVFSTLDGRMANSLEIVIGAADAANRLVGQTRYTADIRFSSEAYSSYRQSGLPIHTSLQVKSVPRQLKIVVYDRLAGLAGSLHVTLKKG